MLRCTYCKKKFSIQFLDLEFKRCPICKTGFLVGGYFAKTGKSALDLEPPDDFFDSGYVNEKPKFYQPNPNEIVNKHLMHRCYNMRVLPVWNLQLSADDIDTQRFMTCTIDVEVAKHIVEDIESGEIITEAINKMSEIFVNTFGPRLLSD